MKSIKQAVYLSLLMGSGVVFAANAPVTDLSRTSGQNERLAMLERLMQAHSQSQLDIQQQLDSLLQEVNELRGAAEIHNHQIEQLVERQRELYQELEDRFSRQEANTRLLSVVQSAVGAGGTGGAGAAGSGSGSAGAIIAAPYSESYSENEAYDRATNLVLKERRYDEAIPEFEAFIKRFPESVYAPNAHYWLGQLLFNKGRYGDAKSQFERVANYFPDSNKRSDAIFKLGSIALKSNDKVLAKALYAKVVEEYPGTTSAKLATSRLQTIK